MWQLPPPVLPTPLTVTAIVVLPATPVPPLPEIVSMKVPDAAALVADTVTTLLLVAGLVPKATLTPVGGVDAVNVTEPVNPPVSAMFIVSVALLPALTVRDGA